MAVGESLAQRDAGQTHEVLRSQVTQVFEGADARRNGGQRNRLRTSLPAIGTGRNATPAQAQEAIGWIRDTVAAAQGRPAAERVRIQYGGSVTPENCAELLSREGIDGALVGGAGLDAGKFAVIVRAAA